MVFLAAIYISVFFFEMNKSLACFFNFKHLKESSGIDMFSTQPHLKSYLILKPMFWPWFFITERNPLESISETFFKNYGNEGTLHFGTKGIKNFSNDMLKGKNRYRGCSVETFSWPLDKQGGEYQKHRHVFKDNQTIFASITYTTFNRKHLLRVILSTDPKQPQRGKVSRFDLDECERLPLAALRNKLNQINHEKSAAWFQQKKLDA